MNRKRKSYCWLRNPIVPVLFVMLLLAFYLLFPSSLFESLYSYEKKENLVFIVFCFLFCLLIILGVLFSLMGKKRENATSSLISRKEIYGFSILFYITLCAYLIWYLNALITIDFSTVIKDFLSKGFTSIWNTDRGHISGITTFTEFGPVLCSIGTSLYFKSKSKKQKKKILKKILLIVFLSLIRFFVFSERLATIELIVPIFITSLFYKKIKPIQNYLLPFLLLLLLYFAFTFGEYFRSWKYYSSSYSGSVFSFSFFRLVGYYATSINNGSVLSNSVYISFTPYRFFTFIKSFPILGEIYTSSSYYSIFQTAFNLYCNPEFNNCSGFLDFYLDFGYGSLLFSLIFGIVIGKSFLKAKQQDTFSVAFFSIAYFCLLEIPRLSTIGLSRGLFFALSLFVFSFYRGKRKRNCLILLNV